MWVFIWYELPYIVGISPDEENFVPQVLSVRIDHGRNKAAFIESDPNPAQPVELHRGIHDGHARQIHHPALMFSKPNALPDPIAEPYRRGAVPVRDYPVSHYIAPSKIVTIDACAMSIRRRRL